jgi:hypothetical protein
MIEPKRLLEQLESGVERDLLRVGTSERAPAAARRRLEGALLGAAPLALAVVPPPEAAAAAGGLSAPSTSALFASVAKWLAIGALAGVTLSGGAVSVVASLPEAGPELLALPSVSRQVENATSRMKTERAPRNAEAAVLAPEAKTRQTTMRRPSGTVWIGPPTLRVKSPDPSAAPRASTSER